MMRTICKNVVGPKIKSMRLQLNWTQEELARQLRRMGWNVTRSGVAKIEAQLVHVGDADLLYFARLFEVASETLYPDIDRDEHLGSAVKRLLSRKRAA